LNLLNDTYGHNGGDMVLKQLAVKLMGAFLIYPSQADIVAFSMRLFFV